jgi:hypothetical protein
LQKHEAKSFRLMEWINIQTFFSKTKEIDDENIEESKKRVSCCALKAKTKTIKKDNNFNQIARWMKD